MENKSQNKAIFRKLIDLPYGTTVRDPDGRKGNVVCFKGKPQCGIYLHGRKRTDKYDWDTEVEVLEYPRTESFIYLT